STARTPTTIPFHACTPRLPRGSAQRMREAILVYFRSLSLLQVGWTNQVLEVTKSRQSMNFRGLNTRIYGRYTCTKNPNAVGKDIMTISSAVIFQNIL
ncbi:hypothetical protein T310_8895, partial [Rasamsonia emersonii CBS 393.64]